MTKKLQLHANTQTRKHANTQTRKHSPKYVMAWALSLLMVALAYTNPLQANVLTVNHLGTSNSHYSPEQSQLFQLERKFGGKGTVNFLKRTYGTEEEYSTN